MIYQVVFSDNTVPQLQGYWYLLDARNRKTAQAYIRRAISLQRATRTWIPVQYGQIPAELAPVINVANGEVK